MNFFKWKENKPIILILAHELSDGNFNNRWNLFLDDKEWLEQTIKKIRSIKDVNWLIKPHPSEKIYNSKINTKSLFNEFIDEKISNVKLFPDDYNVNNFYKFITAAITSHGTPGYEYPALGIPTIVCGDTSYYGLGFNKEPKSRKAYFSLLKNIKNIKSLSNDQQDKSKVFWYVFNFLGKAIIPTIHYSSVNMDYDRKKFWKVSLNLLNKYKGYSGNFYRSLEYQLKNNNSNLINLKELSNIKKNIILKNY